MYGAMLGDIIGSRFEFDRGGKSKDFKLFTDTSLYNIDQTYTTASGKVTYKNEYERQIKERDPEHPDYKIIEFKDEKLSSGRASERATWYEKFGFSLWISSKSST